MRRAAPMRFVMISGNAGNDDTNLLNVASEALKSADTFADGAGAARDAVAHALASIVARNPAMRARLRAVPGLSTLYAFGLDEKGRPAVHIVRFEWREEPASIMWSVEAACPTNCGPVGKGSFISGDRGAAIAYLGSHPKYFDRAEGRPAVGIEGGIGKLLRLAILANPNECGWPLTIVHVSASGAWIKYGQCDEKKRTKVRLPGGAPR